MKRKKTFKLEPYLPVGYDAGYEIKYFVVGMTLSILWGCLYFRRLYNAWSHLWEMGWRNGELVRTKVIEGAMMRTFEDLFFRPNSLAGFFVVACMMIGLMVGHYLYHYQISKSIYVMKRLPDKRELFRRCFTLPLIGLGICILIGALFYIISFWIYMYVTPPECMVGWQLQNWRVFVC